jgi:hypothetical protein
MQLQGASFCQAAENAAVHRLQSEDFSGHCNVGNFLLK